MPDTIAAIVVTYNRCRWLIECLNSLRHQTRPLDRIFIVDNASTDGTPEALRDAGYLNDRNIEYCRMPKNTGGAGGFSEGLKRAYEAKYDWFWLMDDDVEALPEALERLLPYRLRSGCIHGRRVDADGEFVPWGEFFDPHTVTTTPIHDKLFAGDRQVEELNVACFEGMLVSREVVSQIGFPDPSYFIGLDDTFYGFLASRVTPILCVNVTTLRRKRPLEFNTRPAIFGGGLSGRFSTMYLYYQSRNRYLIARALRNRSIPFLLASVRVFLRSLLRELLVNRSGRGATAVLRGTIAGLHLWLEEKSSSPTTSLMPVQGGQGSR